MPSNVILPGCLTEVYEYLFPTIDFSRVSFYDGIPTVLDNGQQGITIGSVGFSTKISVYIKEGLLKPDPFNTSNGPCSFDTFLLLAHELVHVLQIQDSVLGGKFPGQWVFKYIACFVGKFTFSSHCDNRLEEEAYNYSDGCPGHSPKSGMLRDYINQTAFANQSPCDCSSLPWYQRKTIGGISLLDAIKVFPDLVKRSSDAKAWKCSLNPIAFLLGFIAAAFSITGFKSVGAAIGAGIGIIGGGIAGFFLGGPLGMFIGMIAGAVIGGYIGDFIEDFVDIFGDSDPRDLIWFTLFDGTQWMLPDLRISQGDNTRTKAGPALAVYNQKLYLAYSAVDSNDIRYNYFDFNTRKWLVQDKKISNNLLIQANDVVSLAEYNGKLYMVYSSASNNYKFMYTYLDGQSWLGQAFEIPSNSPWQRGSSPALAVFNGKLYIVYTSRGSDELWYNYYDGQRWLDEDLKITSNESQVRAGTGPAAAVFNGKLYIAFKSVVSGELWYNYYDGQRWLDRDRKITSNSGHTLTSHRPALAAYNGKLYMAYKSGSNDYIWYNYFDGNAWLEQDICVTKNGNIQTADHPALAEFGSLLWLVYKDTN